MSSPSPQASSQDYKSAPTTHSDHDSQQQQSRPQSLSGTNATRVASGLARRQPASTRLSSKLSWLDSHQFVEHFRIGEPVEEKVRVVVGNNQGTGPQASYILSGKLLCDHSPFFTNLINKAHFDGTLILDHIAAKDFECIIHYLYMRDFRLPPHANGAAQLQQYIDFGCVTGELEIRGLLDDVVFRIRELLADDRSALGVTHLEYAGSPVVSMYFPQLLGLLMDIWVESELARLVRRFRSGIHDAESQARVLDCFEERLAARVATFRHAAVPHA